MLPRGEELVRRVPATAPHTSTPHTTARFCTVADAQHFVGLVGLVNSLRLQSHAEPISVLDLGLEPNQRDVLASECDMVAPPALSPRHPWLLEPLACAIRPADPVLYIDSDIIVTRPLHGLVLEAAEGHVCAFGDDSADRWFPEWEQIFGLRRPPRHQPYINAGFVAFSTAHVPNLLERWTTCCERLVTEPTYLDTGSLASPVALSSQDALNAVLMSEVDGGALAVGSATAFAQGPNDLAHTRVVDLERLQCQRDGRPVTMLHAWGSPKPWQSAAARTLRRSAYLHCLRRLVRADDVAVRAPMDSLPPWLHPGARGRISLWTLTQAPRVWRGARRHLRPTKAAPQHAPASRQD
jgi:hypothetical protein